ncbi:MAG: hypothetical protein JOY59_08085, partial [Candidatus Eremiobacteraeota bacterium]|nr:hypothetical protein [Candidatus Eremiobacteraeota bacterium]
MLVLALGPLRRELRRALPSGVDVIEAEARDAVAVLASRAEEDVLVIDPALVGAFEFRSPCTAGGGIAGGCALEAGGRVRFGAVFSAAVHGPYASEAIGLVESPASAPERRPAPDAIDAVNAGAYVVDRAAFVAAGGFDPHFGEPWRTYDLCLRLRERGAPVRWEATLAFHIVERPAGPGAPVDRRDFDRRYGARMATRVDFETPARGAIRRAVRLPLGQHEIHAIALPPVELIVVGDGDVNPWRAATEVKIARVRDGRGDGFKLLREALRTRADRYLAVVDAGLPPPERWLERMLVDLESAANTCAVRERGRTLIALGRIPLDVHLPASAASLDAALEAFLREASTRGRVVRGTSFAPVSTSEPRSAAPSTSVIVLAHSTENIHEYAFDKLYGGDLETDYHVVVPTARPELLARLRNYSTLDVIADESRNFARGLNAALARSRGDLIALIADDFYPSADWLDILRGA